MITFVWQYQFSFINKAADFIDRVVSFLLTFSLLRYHHAIPTVTTLFTFRAVLQIVISILSVIYTELPTMMLSTIFQLPHKL